MKRRDFLAAAGAATAASLLPGVAQPVLAAASDSRGQPNRGRSPRRIDVHHHLVPDFYVATLAERGITGAGGVPFPVWSPTTSLAMMDTYGIETAIMSLSSPGVYFDDAPLAVNLARQVNDYAAGVVADRPDRFGFFAAMPMPLLDDAITEAGRALDELHADGIVLLASSGDQFLGDPRFDPLLEVLDERAAVVFIHPNVHSSSLALGLTPPVPPGFLIEFMFDTTRAVTNLVWYGAFERYPNIRWIIAHAGATIPYLAWRLSLMNRIPGFLDRAPRGAIHYLQQLYYDTALSPSPYAMSALLELVGPDHILFGSDFPFASAATIVQELHDFDNLDVFNRRIRQKVNRTNALTLFPRLAD